MVIGVVAGEQLYEQIKKLNFRGEYDIRWIKPQEPAVICRTLESDQEYTDVLIDAGSLKTANADEAVSLVDRLLRTTQLHIMVLADGYLPESRLIRDLVSVGVTQKDIFLQTGVKLQMRISNLLHTVPPVEKAAQVPTETPEQKEEAQAVEQPVPAAVVPPSQVDAATGKSMQIRKPARPTTRAVTIAVAGGGPRIGATTQAMQLLHYLTAQNFRCAYVDVQQADQMRQYLTVYDKCEQLGPHEYTIQGCHFLDTGKQCPFGKKTSRCWWPASNRGRATSSAGCSMTMMAACTIFFPLFRERTRRMYATRWATAQPTRSLLPMRRIFSPTVGMMSSMHRSFPVKRPSLNKRKKGLHFICSVGANDRRYDRRSYLKKRMNKPKTRYDRRSYLVAFNKKKKERIIS